MPPLRTPAWRTQPGHLNIACERPPPRASARQGESPIDTRPQHPAFRRAAPLLRRPPLKAAICLAGLAYVDGLLIGGLSRAVQRLSRKAPPGLAWWQGLLAPLTLGGVAMAGEWLFQTLQPRTGLGRDGRRRSKRLLHRALLFVLRAAGATGTALCRGAAVEAPARNARGPSSAEDAPGGPRGTVVPASWRGMATRA